MLQLALQKLFLAEVGSGISWHHLLRRTLPLKEQYSATEARRHKAYFSGEKMEVYFLLHLPVCSGLHGGLYKRPLGSNDVMFKKTAVIRLSYNPAYLKSLPVSFA
jgi:hypothetical protein